MTPTALPRGTDASQSHDRDVSVSALASGSALAPRSNSNTRRAFRQPRQLIAVVIAVVLSIGIPIGIARRGRSFSATQTISTIGVLPFVNMSADPDNRYFGDGLTEQIITSLSRIEGLRVAARTSSFALRDRNLDVRTIGETLGVAAVLEGSVHRDADRVRITAQLIDAQTGYHLWANEYYRELKDIFVIQNEIATAIATALERQLPREPMSARVPSDFESYDYYLRGLHLRGGLTTDGLQQAVEFFDSAIARSPRFAPAYAGTASIIGPQVMFGYVNRAEGVKEFRALSDRASALDSMLGEAHVAQGILQLFFECNSEKAETELRRAVALNPSDAHGYHHLANYLHTMGRFYRPERSNCTWRNSDMRKRLTIWCASPTCAGQPRLRAR